MRAAKVRWKEDVRAVQVDALRLAMYIRSIADQGAGINISQIPYADQSFPGLDLQAHSQNSASWPADNIRALASEYTTLPWDNGAGADWPGCGYFVLEAYHDVVGSGGLK